MSDSKSLKSFCLQDQLKWSLLLWEEEDPLLRLEVLQSMEVFAQNLGRMEVEHAGWEEGWVEGEGQLLCLWVASGAFWM